jgi:hypothetical protein
LRRWPFTLNNVPSSVWRVTAPCDEVFTTINGPSHLLWSFSCPNNLTLELKSNTLSLGTNSLLILLSCYLLVLSLYILELWYARLRHSSNSKSCIFLFTPAASKSCSITWWPNELWILTPQVDDRSSHKPIDMVTYPMVSYRLFCQPIVHRVIDLSM